MISKVIAFTGALVVAAGLGVSANAAALNTAGSAAFKGVSQTHAAGLVHQAGLKKHKKIKHHRSSNRKHSRFNRHRSFDRFDKFYRRHDFGHRNRLHPKHHRSSRVFLSHQSPKKVTGLVPWTPAWHRHCASKYKSFNPKNGTFLTYSGHRKFCS